MRLFSQACFRLTAYSVIENFLAKLADRLRRRSVAQDLCPTTRHVTPCLTGLHPPHRFFGDRKLLCKACRYSPAAGTPLKKTSALPRVCDDLVLSTEREHEVCCLQIKSESHRFCLKSQAPKPSSVASLQRVLRVPFLQYIQRLTQLSSRQRRMYDMQPP